MADIKLNDILHLTDDEIDNSRIEFNMRAGSGGQPFLDRWLNHTMEEKENGKCFDCSYWGWYSENRRNFRPGNWVFSFVRITDDEWLFISAAKIIDVPKNTWAKVESLERFQPLFGKMIIRFRKGNTYSLYAFKMNKYIDDCNIKEIRSDIYSGETFEGYDNVYLPFCRLDNIFSGRIMPTYYEALRKIKGVYCLTDKNTGKLYIGSATGEEGVAQRWGSYLASKDGGNKKLIALKKKEGEEYFEKYFTFTLIEFFTLSYDDDKIHKRERYWKKCFDTVDNGYNDNY